MRDLFDQLAAGEVVPGSDEDDELGGLATFRAWLDDDLQLATSHPVEELAVEELAVVVSLEGRRRRLSRRAGALAATTAIVLGLSGTGVAAASAEYGSALYPVHRIIWGPSLGDPAFASALLVRLRTVLTAARAGDHHAQAEVPGLEEQAQEAIKASDTSTGAQEREQELASLTPSQEATSPTDDAPAPAEPDVTTAPDLPTPDPATPDPSPPPAVDPTTAPSDPPTPDAVPTDPGTPAPTDPAATPTEAPTPDPGTATVPLDPTSPAPVVASP